MGNYQPSDGAPADASWQPIYLAYRDIAGRAPIDKVGYTSVHMTPACFGNGTYDNSAFQTCFSNLLATEYRRFIFDVYWDTSNHRFSLCPVQLPDIDSSSSTAQAAAYTSRSLAASSSATQTAASAFQSLAPSSDTAAATADGLSKRQAAASGAGSAKILVSSTSSSVTSIPSSSTATTDTSITKTTDPAGSTLYDFGPFQCSDDINLDSLIDIYSSYVSSMANQVQARLQILQFNLHAAALLGDPYGLAPTPSPGDMPDQDSLIGSQLDNNYRDILYKPGQLLQDRSNLNASWLKVTTKGRLPILKYYNSYNTSHGDIATDDGWPSELYILFTQFRQTLVTWGTTDPQMAGYGFSNDSDIVFPANYLDKPSPYQASAAGIVTSGCLYENNVTSVSQVNNTWGLAYLNQAGDVNNDVIRNLTSCGLAPTINSTLDGLSAADGYVPYQNLSRAAIFGWAPGQPINVTQGVGGDQLRCVVIDSSDAYQGHWRVDNCQSKHRAACRVGGQPYQWRLSSYNVRFGDAPDACQDDAEFDVPATGLENTYLYNHILGENDTQRRQPFVDGVWINLNDLDTANCWVTTGPDGTCRYSNKHQEKHDREVLIPTIGALLVLILTALTILVKCNSNYLKNRHRRSGPGGWQYEGVPS